MIGLAESFAGFVVFVLSIPAASCLKPDAEEEK